MIINTDNIDLRDLAIRMLKRKGTDWIDKTPDELWPEKNEAERADMVEWRDTIVQEEMHRLEGLLALLSELTSPAEVQP